MEDLDEQLDKTFRALADRTRRKMLERLTAGEATVSELGEPFGLTKQAVSKHLKVLEEADLVRKTRDGRLQRCVFNPEALKEVHGLVNHYSEFWKSQLDSLEQYIDSIKDKGEKK
jgi:DNA-binding transcriptional ArsR family regulator